MRVLLMYFLIFSSFIFNLNFKYNNCSSVRTINPWGHNDPKIDHLGLLLLAAIYSFSKSNLPLKYASHYSHSQRIYPEFDLILFKTVEAKLTFLKLRMPVKIMIFFSFVEKRHHCRILYCIMNSIQTKCEKSVETIEFVFAKFDTF